MNFSISAKATISSNFRSISRLLIPKIDPLKYVFSRPESSGWNPVPTSSKLRTRPRISAQPSVGRVMRDNIFSSVVFPAPFRPISPSTSPSRTSSETSFSAQNISGFAPRSARQGDLANSSKTCRSPVSTRTPPVPLPQSFRSDYGGPAHPCFLTVVDFGTDCNPGGADRLHPKPPRSSRQSSVLVNSNSLHRGWQTDLKGV